ncbi:MAG: hypothetical protein HW406_2971 [Candidatus Brocadiaceae bacterium]|nr:hypothetical protein [Candidatus Brocadiaceae bacterium]
MQHEHHDLIHEFPEYREEIHTLKTSTFGRFLMRIIKSIKRFIG